MKKLALLVVFLMPVLPLAVQAQDDEDKGAGRVFGNYNVMQSIEVGDRITGVDGNQQVYQTFVNLKNGPRLLEQDLTMRSLNHEGTLFDNLYLSSFGFGGDPDQVARLRVEKNKWYNFVGLYRRDINFFDYDLFANPLTLNPGIVNCSTVVKGAVSPCVSAFNPQTNFFYANSPHLQDTTRNMGDFFLTLLPQSVVHFRLGFARNDNKGTVDSSLEDVNIPLTQQSHTRSDRWTFGVDVLPAPRTTVSFTEYYQHDKLDIDYVNNPVNNLSLGSTGTPVTIPLYFPPCTITGATGLPLAPVTAPGVLNPLCNTGVFNYARSENVRTGLPTSELSFHSTYFRKLDITAGGTYTDGQSKVLNYNDLFYGLVSRTDQTAYLVTGEPKTERVSASANLGLTYHINKQWSVADQFRWLDWRDPGVFTQATLGCYSNLATGETLSTPTGAPCGIPGIATVGSAATLVGTPPSPTVYNGIDSYSLLEAERTFYNTARLQWDPSRKFDAYLGYRYGRRELKTSYMEGITNFDVSAINTPVAGVPVFAPLTTNKINENTALLGTVIRPTVNWRINADTELLSADNAFNNITPRHQQRVRARTVYKVKRWASVNGGINLVESRNDWAQNFSNLGNLFPASVAPAYGTKSHSRYYSVGATLNPNGRLSVEFGYTYLDQGFDTAACMLLANTALLPGGVGNLPTACPNTGTYLSTVPANFNIAPQSGDTNVPVTQAYREHTNTGYVNILVRPVRRVTVILGYEITSTTGSDNWISAQTGLPLQVFGDVYGNAPGLPGNPGTVIAPAGSPVAGSAVGTIPFLGPFPDQPLGPQVFNWHRPSAAVAYEIRKNLTFKGAYAFYDYNEKEGNLPLTQIVTLPRNFHANVGTVSLRYSF